MPDVLIIIVTYNGMEWLPKCLKSTTPYTVIIVDNNSSDGTVSFIEENHPELTLFKQKTNLGFGQANNLGISYALKKNADYVFLLNQDAYLHTETIDKLISFHQAKPEFGIISPIHLNGKGNRLDEKFSHYLSYSNNRDFYSDFVLKKEKKEIYEVPFVNGAAWLVSKACLEKVGGFDPMFFHYGEDDNYCQRVIYHKLKIGVVPNTFIYHDREKREVNIRSENPPSLSSLERWYKIKFSDLNVENLEELEDLILKKRKVWIKAILKLDKKLAFRSKEEYRLLLKLKPEVIRSRRINKIPGPHYLNRLIL